MPDPIATSTPAAHAWSWIIWLSLGCLAWTTAWFLVSILWNMGLRIHEHIKRMVMEDYTTDIADSARAVEKLLNYEFKSKRLLEAALTHSSCSHTASYERLEWLGDSALGLSVSDFLFWDNPAGFNPGQLSLLRIANTTNERLARVAVRCGLHRHFRHNVADLDRKVNEFALAVQDEVDSVVHGGQVKAPKVLADIVESLAGAVYVDCKSDLQAFWMIFRTILEPIIDLETHPVDLLYVLCQKDGRKVMIKSYKEGEKTMASIYVDDELIASASSATKLDARIQAARTALEKLCLYECNSTMDVDCSCIPGTTEIEGAKQKLYALCGKKRWPKPFYEIVKESGPSHERRHVCSVEIETGNDALGYLHVDGGEWSRVRDAENSAASSMIGLLRELKSIN